MDRDIALAIVTSLDDIKTTVQALSTNTIPPVPDSRSLDSNRMLMDTISPLEDDPAVNSRSESNPESEPKTTTRKK